jgi:molybdopterin-guanine dinucleotide biosynthesis adapter protein
VTHAARVLGITGWSGSGKTTLLTRLLPVLTARGLRIATLKHAHHDFDVDTPGKDSWAHRAAGASEVIVASSRRWVQMHELGGEAEPPLAALLARVSPCDLVLVEGWKRERHPRMEIFRPVLGQAPLWPADPGIVAVAGEGPPVAGAPRWVPLDDVAAVAACVLDSALPLADVLATLAARR